MSKEIIPDLTFDSYDPTPEEEKTVRDIWTRKTLMDSHRQEEENRWDRWDDLYISYTESTQDFRSTINPPVTFSIIESAKTEIIDQRLKYQLKANNIDFEENQEVIENIVTHVWNKSDGDLEYYKVIHDTLLYGTAMMKVEYSKDIREVRDIVKFDIDKKTGKEIKKYKDTEVVDFDDVRWRQIDIRNFFIDESATSFEDARDCIERKVMDINEFRRIFGMWSNAKCVRPGGDTMDPELPRENVSRLPKTAAEGSGHGLRENKRGDEGNLVEVLEYWNKPLDRHVVVANNVLIFDEPIPYDHKDFPYARNVDVLIPNEFYGMGEAEIVQHYHEEMKQLRRMQLDYAHVSTHNMFITDQHFDEAELYTEPGKIIYVERGGNFQPVQIPEMKNNIVNQVEMLRKDTEDATGINRQLIGAQAGGGTTLGEVQLLKESALKRLRLKMRISESLGLKRLGRLTVATIQQYYRRGIFQKNSLTGKMEENKRIIRVEGKDRRLEFQPISPEDIRGDFEVEVIPGSSLPMSRGLRLRSLIDLFPILREFMAPGPNGEEPLVSREQIIDMLFKEAELPMDALLTKGGRGIEPQDIISAIQGGKPTQDEIEGQITQQQALGQMQQQAAPEPQIGPDGQPLPGSELPPPPIPEQAIEKGFIPRPEEPQEPAADDVAPPDIAAAEDHTDRILAGEEVVTNEGVITPRHIEIHVEDLEDPVSELGQADPETRRAMEAHVEEEKEILQDRLSDLTL